MHRRRMLSEIIQTRKCATAVTSKRSFAGMFSAKESLLTFQISGVVKHNGRMMSGAKQKTKTKKTIGDRSKAIFFGGGPLASIPYMSRQVLAPSE